MRYFLIIIATLSIISVTMVLREPLQGSHLKQLDSPITDELICVVGDSGSNPSQVKGLASSMLELGCTQIRILGDVIYPSGITHINDPLFEAHFLQPFSPLLDANIPVYIVLGNHDLKQDSIPVWLEISRTFNNIHYPSPYYFEQWQDVCIFSLETTFFEKLYRPVQGINQLRWIQSTKETFKPDCRFSLVLAHHPYRSPGPRDGAVPQLELFLGSSIIGNVDLYMAGHEHILADAGLEDGTRMLISGSASKSGDISEHSETYATRKPGLIALSFKSDSNTITATYRFLTYSAEQGLIEEKTGSIVGQGIR